MDWNSLSSGLVGSLIGVILSSFLSYFKTVREARNLRIMLSREIEENMFILSQAYANAKTVFITDLDFPNFNFLIWDLTSINAPSFLHKNEIDQVSVFYRKLREISEIKKNLKNAEPQVKAGIIKFFVEEGSKLGKGFNPVGKQNLNFLNYYFLISKKIGNTLGEGNYHYVYPQGIYFDDNYDNMPYIKRMIKKTKKIIYQIWYK
ncbi:hypothetical protein [Nostoc sp. UHCC 0870]|uniref:hypothetical protein n=1 Tax=Nostoc sp. UHCC 0870 TaxID=2914041 RepID=UPI001EDD2AFE|nr:hypothetical protein [Nostoc sp. UHCC 0870]UKO97020.1 hypothetical protein L6494_20855 [Nostoc sp. UHCC 0870]